MVNKSSDKQNNVAGKRFYLVPGRGSQHGFVCRVDLPRGVSESQVQDTSHRLHPRLWILH